MLKGLRTFSRGLKFQAKDYAASPGFSKYSAELEKAIAATLASTPAPTKVYTNTDGTVRALSDKELQNAAALGALADSDRATLGDKFRMTREQSQQLHQNDALLMEYFLNGRRILDKIPTENPETGEVTWTVVRENQKEGWESIMYYGYVPGLLAALGLYFFLDKEHLGSWAAEELRLRAAEAQGEAALTGSQKEQDDLIVERILSGDYDRLAGVRKASNLPSSLL